MEERIREFAPSAEGLALLVKELRKPYGCPWDQKQTIESLRGSLTGECAEVVEAVDLHDRANLCEELGDLLMNIVFMAVVAEEDKEKTMRVFFEIQALHYLIAGFIIFSV